MKNYKISLIVIFFSLSLWIACQNGEQPVKNRQALPVKTIKAKTQTVDYKIYSSGLLASKNETRLSFKTGGIIGEIYFDEGQQVKKGQLLAALDLSEINARHQQAKIGLLKAERDFKRVAALYKDSAATYEQYQDAQTARDIARSNLKIADFNLKHSKIFAPEDGRILKRFMNEGEMAGPGNPFIVFGSTQNKWIVRAGVTDKDILRLKLEDQALVSFDSYPGIKFMAEVSEIAAAANPASGTYEVEIRLMPESKKLLSGFTAKVEIIPSKKENYVVIPVESLVEGKEMSGYVYLLDEEDSSVKKQPVEIAYIMNEDIVLRSGLDDQQEIISEGTPYLFDGAKVQVLN